MQLVFLVLNSLGLVGLGIFLWFIWRGLFDRINALQQTASEQAKTLGVVRERADEFDRLSQRYKQALLDFEEMGKKMEERRQHVVQDLEEAIRQKDAEIVALKRVELKKVEQEQESLAKISNLSSQIGKLEQEIQKHAAAITELDPLSEFRALARGASLYASLESFAETEARKSTSGLGQLAESIYTSSKEPAEVMPPKQKSRT